MAREAANDLAKPSTLRSATTAELAASRPAAADIEVLPDAPERPFKAPRTYRGEAPEAAAERERHLQLPAL